jgi:APA family basic amino acid/polyamine antiporter
MAGLISLRACLLHQRHDLIGPRVAMTMGEDCRALSSLAVKTRGGVPGAALGLSSSASSSLLLLTATFDKVVNYIQFSLTVCSFLTVLGPHRASARASRRWRGLTRPRVILSLPCSSSASVCG